MKQIISSLFLLSSLTTFAQDKTISNDLHSAKRNLTGTFNAITVTDGIDLFITQGNEESVTVGASDEKYLENFKTDLVNGTLKIYYESKGINLGINGKKNLKAYVTFKSLEKLNASSGATVAAKTGIEVDSLEMKFSSGAHFTGQVSIKNLTVDQSSGSGISITGKSEKLKVEVNSGAIFKGFELTADYCNAQASSGAGVHITVNKELNAKATSGGGIRYKGNAVIKDVNVNSGGSVKKE